MVRGVYESDAGIAWKGRQDRDRQCLWQGETWTGLRLQHHPRFHRRQINQTVPCTRCDLPNRQNFSNAGKHRWTCRCDNEKTRDLLSRVLDERLLLQPRFSCALAEQTGPAAEA
jgi:hypothetical protein